MRNTFCVALFAFLSNGFYVAAQPVTDHFTIEGSIAKSVTMTLDSLKSFNTVQIDSITIYNYLMQRKSSLQKVEGVRLVDVLNRVSILSESPKKLSEFYIECIAADGYTVLFSWNEVFNTENGKKIMVITKTAGKSAATQPDHIALISPTDLATGRRYVKGLDRIIIQHVKQ